MIKLYARNNKIAVLQKRELWTFTVEELKEIFVITKDDAEKLYNEIQFQKKSREAK